MDNKAFLLVALSVAMTSPIQLAHANDATSQSGALPSPDLMYSIPYVQSNLLKGKTTRAEVISSFGSPAFQKVRATDAGASETLYYKRGSQASSGGTIAKSAHGLANVAGGLSRMFGYNKAGSQVADVSNQANNVAGGMDSMGLGGSSNESAGMNGPTSLTVEIVNGLVASYNMQ